VTPIDLAGMPVAAIAVALGLIGLCIGSFLNVCIFRIPLGQSIVHPPSRCMGCGQALRWYHNVPVVSWLLLRGRCAFCGAGVSARYPAVELLTGVVFALHAFVFEPGPLLLVRLAFAAVLIVLAFIDIDHRILPDAMTLTGIPLGVLASVWLPPGWRDSLIGVALGGGSLWLIAEGYYRWRKVEGMGMGDVKMLGMIGAVLGWRAVIVTLVLSSCSGALVGVLMMRRTSEGARYALPFGTFLSAGALAASLVGEPLMAWYLSFYPQ
jgi:leader peptidase (prepilin peptidase) / N-methyltransferase